MSGQGCEACGRVVLRHQQVHVVHRSQCGLVVVEERECRSLQHQRPVNAGLGEHPEPGDEIQQAFLVPLTRTTMRPLSIRRSASERTAAPRLWNTSGNIRLAAASGRRPSELQRDQARSPASGGSSAASRSSSSKGSGRPGTALRPDANIRSFTPSIHPMLPAPGASHHDLWSRFRSRGLLCGGGSLGGRADLGLEGSGAGACCALAGRPAEATQRAARPASRRPARTAGAPQAGGGTRRHPHPHAGPGRRTATSGHDDPRPPGAPRSRYARRRARSLPHAPAVLLRRQPHARRPRDPRVLASAGAASRSGRTMPPPTPARHAAPRGGRRRRLLPGAAAAAARDRARLDRRGHAERGHRRAAGGSTSSRVGQPRSESASAAGLRRHVAAGLPGSGPRIPDSFSRRTAAPPRSTMPPARRTLPRPALERRLQRAGPQVERPTLPRNRAGVPRVHGGGGLSGGGWSVQPDRRQAPLPVRGDRGADRGPAPRRAISWSSAQVPRENA